MTPWWVTLIIGIGTAAVTIAGVFITSGRQQQGLRVSQRGEDRAEWFRRVQWAQSLLASPTTQDAGLNVLRVLAVDADDADVRLIRALVDASPAMEESIELGAAATERAIESGDELVYEVQDGDTESSSSEGAAND